MSKTALQTESADKKAGISASVERHLRTYFAAHENTLPASGLYDRVLQAIELPLLKITMDQCGGNQIKAAALLGLNRNTLRKKLRLLGLLDERDVSAKRRRV